MNIVDFGYHVELRGFVGEEYRIITVNMDSKIETRTYETMLVKDLWIAHKYEGMRPYDTDVEALALSIQKEGLAKPVQLMGGMLVSGWCRLKAFYVLGIERIPVL